MNVDQTIQRGLKNLTSLQAESGSWPSDYGGPMFLLPMWVALAYATRRLPNPERTARLLTYFTNVQRTDGSIGLHAESTSGSMFTSTLSYVAMRLLGMSADDARATKLLGWIHSNGGALGAASWGKFTLCLLGLYDWKGIVPLLPELWLLPVEAPMHPSRLWCHARMVYLPMAWLYGNKSTTPDDPLLRALRDELYQGRYAEIDWEKQRDVVAKADSYRPTTTALKSVNLAQVGFEKLPGFLRKRALDECLKLIRHEDAATHDLDIGPVNAVLNMFVHFFRGSEGREDFERGWPKFDRAYLWDGHDGLKMQGYNNAELWDTAFAVQALTASERAGSLTTEDTKHVLGRAYFFLRDNQILEDVPEAERHYRRATVCEPRGNDVLVGAVLLPPRQAGSLASVVFFNNVGYLGMCGHGTIGLMATLEYLGRVQPGRYALDTPVGTVQVELHGAGEVSVDNVPAYRHLAGVTLQVPQGGQR